MISYTETSHSIFTWSKCVNYFKQELIIEKQPCYKQVYSRTIKINWSKFPNLKKFLFKLNSLDFMGMLIIVMAIFFEGVADYQLRKNNSSANLHACKICYFSHFKKSKKSSTVLLIRLM